MIARAMIEAIFAQAAHDGVPQVLVVFRSGAWVHLGPQPADPEENLEVFFWRGSTWSSSAMAGGDIGGQVRRAFLRLEEEGYASLVQSRRCEHPIPHNVRFDWDRPEMLRLSLSSAKVDGVPAGRVDRRQSLRRLRKVVAGIVLAAAITMTGLAWGALLILRGTPVKWAFVALCAVAAVSIVRECHRVMIPLRRT